MLTLFHREESDVGSSFKGQQKPRQQAHLEAITQPLPCNETHEELASKWEPTTEHVHTSARARRIPEMQKCRTYIHTYIHT